MNEGFIMNYKVLPLILLIIISIAGCLFQDSERDHGFEHYIYVKGVKGDYIYFPVIVDSENKTFLDISEYYFETGSGAIEKVSINGTDYLNISLGTEEIEIKVIRKSIPINSDTITYSGIYKAKGSFGGGPLVDYPATEIYCSGNIDNSVSSYLSIGKSEPYKTITIGRIHLNQGWTPVPVSYGKTML